jgi:prepilin-type N-terminal cleavage/methylation domain-containing protein
MKKLRTQPAFTLAETLITIAIIGVVAALTIPTLIKQYQRKVFETQFKKAYSQLNSAYKLMQEEDTEDVYSEYYHATDDKGTALRESFYKHLKGNYLPKTIYSNPKIYYTSYKGSTTRIHYCPASCCRNPADSQAFLTFDNIMYYACARDGRINFSFDINGNDKGPNKWGVDFFDVEIDSDNKLYAPTSAVSCAIYDNKNGSSVNVNDGGKCSYYALKDKDYFKKIDW